MSQLIRIAITKQGIIASVTMRSRMCMSGANVPNNMANVRTRSSELFAI